ncbi:aminoacetone oxidase family FAD-binding enzyme [bacterium]|nr:aminoacetone oxidase family FAD-binding enzyme [bacterium]
MNVDIAIIGAGAAGLAAAVFGGPPAREAGLSLAVLDGARRPGAKILVSGGGRCNVTNERVTPDDYWGGPRPLIRKALRAFDQDRTIEWMRELGVDLKLEPTGKYFPATDQARTVLDALMRGATRGGTKLMPGVRVTKLRRDDEGFRIECRGGDPIRARRVILATGGLSLPKSGSDGWGLGAARRLGHTIVEPVPALVPLVLGGGGELGRWFADLSGLATDVRLRLESSNGRGLEECAGAMLFTHFGISGPAALDLSRHWERARAEGAEGLRVTMGLSAFEGPEKADAWLVDQAAAHPKRSPAAVLGELVPERMARALADGVDGTLGELTRERRKTLAKRLTRLELDVRGQRGWAFAETTAGGVDLREVDMRTMESRVVPGLHLCGEMLDVDGRLGGFNFQWAWATGYLAGSGAVRAFL